MALNFVLNRKWSFESKPIIFISKVLASCHKTHELWFPGQMSQFSCYEYRISLSYVSVTQLFKNTWNRRINIQTSIQIIISLSTLINALQFIFMMVMRSNKFVNSVLITTTLILNDSFCIENILALHYID